MSRTIKIFGEISNETAKDVLDELLEIEEFDEEILERCPDAEIYPITVVINSEGGCVYSANAIYDKLLEMKAPIITQGYGLVASSALYIFSAGDVRKAGKLTQFMHHDISYNADFNTMRNQEVTLEHIKSVNQQMDQELIKRTKLTRENLWFKNGRDYWMDYDEAKEMGIITE